MKYTIYRSEILQILATYRKFCFPSWKSAKFLYFSSVYFAKLTSSENYSVFQEVLSQSKHMEYFYSVLFLFCFAAQFFFLVFMAISRFLLESYLYTILDNIMENIFRSGYCTENLTEMFWKKNIFFFFHRVSCLNNLYNFIAGIYKTFRN